MTVVEVVGSVAIASVTDVEAVGRLAMLPVTGMEVSGSVAMMPVTAVEPTGSLAVNPVTGAEPTGRLAMLPATNVEVIRTLATAAPSAGLCASIHPLRTGRDDGPIVRDRGAWAHTEDREAGVPPKAPAENWKTTSVAGKICLEGGELIASRVPTPSPISDFPVLFLLGQFF